MTQWHPSNDQLIEFASGSCSSAMSIALATHLHFCSACRCQVNEHEATAAVLFEQQMAAPVDAGSFAQLMARIQNEPKPVTRAAGNPVVGTRSRFPSVIEKLVGGSLDQLNWKTPMKNLRVSQLMTDETGLILGLHHMKSGAKVPHHKHRGTEISIVVEGGFSDEMGSYRPGDFIHLTTDHAHAPQADADGDCWLVSLVQAPIKLTGPTGWLLNPFLKP